MSDVSKRVAKRFVGLQLEAMSNLRSKVTGIQGIVIWVSSGEFAGTDIVHGPRIKVMIGDKITTEGLSDAVSVRISDTPKILGDLPGDVSKQIIEFIKLNKNILLSYWNCEIDTKEMLDGLQSI